MWHLPRSMGGFEHGVPFWREAQEGSGFTSTWTTEACRIMGFSAVFSSFGL